MIVHIFSIHTISCLAGILHFKFIDKDLDVFEKRARKNSGFSTGGTIYKQYMDFIKNQGDVNFMYEGSVEFVSSDVLKEIPLINSIEF